MPTADRARRAAAAALVAFSAVTAAVALHLTGALDGAAAEVIRRAASPQADALARGASAIVSGPTTLAAVLLAAALALRAGERRVARVIVAALAAEAGAVQLLKALVGRPRPSWPYTYAALPSEAFPSGHAACAVAVWGLLALLVARRVPGARTAAPLGAALLAAVAGASRIYLGVHFPSDVLGGWLVGAAILGVAASALPPGPAVRGPPDGRALAAPPPPPRVS